jgi:hypothetical protein
MKKRNLLLVILAVLLVFGMVVGCGDLGEGEGTGGGTTGEGALSTVTADGSATATTTTLTLRFTKSVTITAADITLSGVAGVTAGALSGSGTTYTLKINVTQAGGTLSVKVGSVTKTATIYWLDPFLKYYNRAEFQSTRTVGSKQITETAVITKDKITLTDNDRSTDNPDMVEFTVSKWETREVPASVAVAYPEATTNRTFSKGVKVTGKITKARPPDSDTAASTTQVFGTTSCPGITKADIGVTELYFYIYFDESDAEEFYLVKSSFYKANATGQQDPITSRLYKEQS